MPDPGLTYTQVGWTASGWWPPGFASVHRRRVVGHDDGAFDRLAAGIAHFTVLIGAGLAVEADDDVARPGVVVRSTVSPATFLRTPDVVLPRLLRRPLREGVTAPCQVVWADAPVVPLAGPPPARTSGFAYGTLPGHPERGEEAFLAVQEEDGTVVFEVRAFSRPGSWPVAAGAPVARAVQRAITDRYLDAAAAIAGSSTGAPSRPG